MPIMQVAAGTPEHAIRRTPRVYMQPNVSKWLLFYQNAVASI